MTLPFSGSLYLLRASQCCSGALSLDPCFGLGLPVAGVWAQRRWEYGETSVWELDAGGWMGPEGAPKGTVLSPCDDEGTLGSDPSILAKCKEQESGGFA